ncbi:MAG: helix-turn-helix domain-containing protein [Cyclobacteriaceae bacterium]|nr:helix-turn-helix domain-containing protein [Cyclobacteriaceae bacterium]
MELNTDFLSVLLKKQAKPIVKEAFGEFLAENGLALVPISGRDSTKLLSTAEVAKLLGVERHKVYDYIDNGLPAMQSKPYKFRLQDVNEFITTNLKRK